MPGANQAAACLSSVASNCEFLALRSWLRNNEDDASPSLAFA
jgi:hypothetical protein